MKYFLTNQVILNFNHSPNELFMNKITNPYFMLTNFESKKFDLAYLTKYHQTSNSNCSS